MIKQVPYKVNRPQSNIHGQSLQNWTLPENEETQSFQTYLESFQTYLPNSLSMQGHGLKNSRVFTCEVGLGIISKFFRLPNNKSKKQSHEQNDFP